jgi:SET domain-containing protein 6
MRAIKSIDKGSQIYNTYGNLPNHDLLRRYGYVLPGSKDDLVEIASEMIIQTLSRHTEEEVRRRITLLDEEEIFEESVPIPCINF